MKNCSLRMVGERRADPRRVVWASNGAIVARASRGGLAAAASLAILALPPALADAQEAPAQRDSLATESLPLEPTREIRFTTDEGSWMSVDISPDGTTLVFDLLGDLYTRAGRGRHGDAADDRARIREPAAVQPGRLGDRLRVGPGAGDRTCG